MHSKILLSRPDVRRSLWARLTFYCYVFALIVFAAPAQAATTIILEAENGDLTGLMAIQNTATASAGQNVWVPQGSGNNYNDATFGGPGQVSFSINIPQAGTYALWARAFGPDDISDSFYVTGNGTLISEWSIPDSVDWIWRKIANVALSAGVFNLAFRQREDGAMLDQIILTNDLNLFPGSTAAKVAITQPGADFSVGGSTNLAIGVQASGGNPITTDNSTEITFTPSLNGTVQAVATGTLISPAVLPAPAGTPVVIRVVTGQAAVTLTDSVAETFEVAITNNAGLVNPANDSITVTGTAPAGSLQFSAATYNVAENVAGGNATITVRRTGGSAGAVGVNFATSNGTATAGSDYTAVTQTINFAAGDTADKTVNIPITDDTTFESNETINLTLSAPTGGASLGSPNTAILTITENDTAGPPIITVEAESGSRTAPMVVQSDFTASGGQYVVVPEGTGSNFNDATFGGPGQVNLPINIAQTGTYALWARTIAPNDTSDSFYVTRNGTLIKEWSVPLSTVWKWNKIANVSLSTGLLNLAFRQREDGTKLDQVLLTTDLKFVPGTGNQAPSVSAGPDQTVTLPNSASLNGTVIDDGLPNPPAAVSTTWSKISGPGTVTFVNANAVDTSASFSVEGTYVLRLTASDSALQASDDVTITVNPAGSVGADFTIIALPDTQFYAESFPATFSAQTQWIVTNKVAMNIVNVAHLGDIVENGNSFTSEWDVADAAMDLIENPTTTGLPHGIPYGMAVGNHDQTPAGSPAGNSTQLYNAYFGIQRFSGRTYYGGHFGSNNDNHFSLFSAGGMDFIVIYLEYDPAADPNVLAWADDLLKTHVDRRAIVVSHYMVEPGNPAPFGAQGQAIYAALKGNANLFLMLAGHRHGEGRRTDVFNDNPVHTLLSDYQERPNGGDGWLRIMEFSPANNQIRVRTYSPTLNQFETDVDSEFTLSYDMTPNSNVPPVTRVGPDQEITLPTSATLDGTVTDDGLPNPPGALAVQWTKVSGPGTVTFGNANAVDTTASFSQAGAYLLQLTADDGEKKSSADIAIIVNPQTPQLVTLDIEAESGSLTAPMVAQSIGTASGGQYVVVPEGIGNNFNDVTNGGPGQISHSLNIPEPGTYALWARTLAPHTGSNSFYVTSSGTLLREWDVPMSTVWRWNEVIEIFLNAGALNLQFRLREDGTQLDRIILTNDLNFIPQ
jgi:Calx-beta domain